MSMTVREVHHTVPPDGPPGGSGSAATDQVVTVEIPDADTDTDDEARAPEAGPHAATSASAASARCEEPEALLCPITRVMYRDPVFVPEAGDTYEREALLRFWNANPHRRPRDPLTNRQLLSRSLFVNWAKRREVSHWLDVHPDSVPDGWAGRGDVPRPPDPDADPLACFVESTEPIDDDDDDGAARSARPLRSRVAVRLCVPSQLDVARIVLRKRERLLPPPRAPQAQATAAAERAPGASDAADGDGSATGLQPRAGEEAAAAAAAAEEGVAGTARTRARCRRWVPSKPCVALALSHLVLVPLIATCDPAIDALAWPGASARALEPDAAYVAPRWAAAVPPGMRAVRAPPGSSLRVLERAGSHGGARGDAGQPRPPRLSIRHKAGGLRRLWGARALDWVAAGFATLGGLMVVASWVEVVRRRPEPFALGCDVLTTLTCFLIAGLSAAPSAKRALRSGVLELHDDGMHMHIRYVPGAGPAARAQPWGPWVAVPYSQLEQLATVDQSVLELRTREGGTLAFRFDSAPEAAPWLEALIRHELLRLAYETGAFGGARGGGRLTPELAQELRLTLAPRDAFPRGGAAAAGAVTTSGYEYDDAADK